ncbi:MAG: hypothetical protein IT267_10735 [Saprospiraceae bacterium]|nr:hypothetical protein [Saprospiraceae bacterium]
MKFLFYLFSLVSYSINVFGQFDFAVRFDTSRIDPLMKLHSFSYGRIQDNLFVFGGRRDGVHSKTGGFDIIGSNRNLILYNPEKNIGQEFRLAQLDTNLLDALSASNTCFTQVENMLYIIGGYSENSFKNFITYPSLIQVNLELLEEKINNNDSQNISKAFKQIKHERFAVAGGQLKYLDHHFFLVGGHKFTGIYNQMELAFQQDYTESTFVFEITQQNDSLSPVWKNQFRDELNFHRRDFNLSPFYTSKDRIELMAFSGVFLVNINSPYLNLASIHSEGFTDIQNFNQVLANYQCSRIGFYSKKLDRMNTLFFGGMAVNYFDQQDNLINDPYVPFVNTVSRIERDQNGQYSENKLMARMPGFLGSNSEFITKSGTPILYDEIIDQDELSGDSMLIGYIIGGIYNNSEIRNPWQDSLVNLITTNPYLIRTTLIRSNPSTNINKTIRKEIIQLIPLQSGQYRIKVNQPYKKLNLWLTDVGGKIISHLQFQASDEPTLTLKNLIPGIYRCVVLVDNNYQTQLPITIR